MRLRCLATVCAVALLMVASQAARADLLIKVDKSSQQMTVSADGKPLYTWPVSTGRARYNTPSGEYKPLGMDRHHYSREWDDAPMPYSIFFTEEGHAIHGTLEQRSLGRAVSHGCVRLSVKNAAILWDLVKEQGKANTKVVLTGDIPVAKAPVVAHAKRKQREEVADLPAHRQHASRHWRLPRSGERYSYYARQRVYRPRYYDYRYSRNYRPRAYYRDSGFSFFLFPPER
jgi:hypothetical protein